MNVRLVILGLLLEKERHPYDIQHLLQHTHMKYYMKITKGSLYYAFEQLEKNGFISVFNVIQDSARPDRTLYQVTDNGKEEFEKLLLEQITKQEKMHFPLYEALLFAEHADHERVREQLAQRMEQTKVYLTTMENVYEMKYREENIATSYILAGVIMHLRTELTVCKSLYTDLEHHRLTDRNVHVLQHIKNCKTT